MNRCAFVSVCACAWALNTGRGAGGGKRVGFSKRSAAVSLCCLWSLWESSEISRSSVRPVGLQWERRWQSSECFWNSHPECLGKSKIIKKTLREEKKKIMAECISVANTNNTVHLMKREGECCMLRAQKRPVRLGSTCLRVVLRADVGSVSCWEIREKLLADITKTINGNHMSADQSLSYSLRLD